MHRNLSRTTPLLLSVPVSVLVAACGADAPMPLHAVEPPRCVLTGEAEAMTVAVEGLPDLLEVSGLPAEVTLRGDAATARVLRPLLFSGETSVEGLHLRIARAIEGRIAVHEGAAARLSDPCVGDACNDRSATVVLLGASDVERDSWRGVTVRMSVGCEQLGLGPASAPERTERAENGVLLGEQELALYAGPDGAVLGTLRIAAPEGHILRAVRVTERRDGFAHLEHDYPSGRIDAWVASSRVGPTPMGWGDGGTWAPGASSACVRGEYPIDYRGAATVSAGTDVVAEGTGRVWGRFVEDASVTVAVRPSGLVEITELEGLSSRRCGNLDFNLAVVPATAIRLPSDVP